MNIKIISINIEAARLFDQLVQFVAEQKPDILLLQEVFVSATSLDRKFHILRYLQNILLGHYTDRATTYDTIRDGSVVEAGNTLLSRFPITARKVIFYDIPYMREYVEPTHDYSTVPRNLQHVELDVGSARLNVFNTHGIWSAGTRDTPAQLRMSQIIVDQVRHLPNVILGGDFNITPDTQTINNIEQYLVNVFKGVVSSTLNMRRKSNPVYASLVLDMLFVSKEFHVVHKECLNADISDHLPLVVELTL